MSKLVMVRAPAHLPPDVAAIWVEILTADPGVPSGPSLEGYCGQIARLRDAQRRIAAEGLIIADPKGFPIPHPAIAIERAAQAEIRSWSLRFL